MTTPVMPPTKDSRPTRQNWWAAESPPKWTWSSRITWPASATELAMMAPSPTWQSWPTWLLAMKRQPLPMRVTPPPPAVPTLMVMNSRKVLPSPMTIAVSSPRYLRSCGIPPTAAWEKTRLPAPKVVRPPITAWAPTTLSGPRTTWGPITA